MRIFLRHSTTFILSKSHLHRIVPFKVINLECQRPLWPLQSTNPKFIDDGDDHRSFDQITSQLNESTTRADIYAAHVCHACVCVFSMAMLTIMTIDDQTKFHNFRYHRLFYVHRTRRRTIQVQRLNSNLNNPRCIIRSTRGLVHTQHTYSLCCVPHYFFGVDIIWMAIQERHSDEEEQRERHRERGVCVCLV